MKKFSQRKGISPIKDKIQKDSMDRDLRNALWNEYYTHYQKILINQGGPHARQFLTTISTIYFGEPIDLMNYGQIIGKIRKFFFECQWFEVYDFLEFIASNFRNPDFIKSCNAVLKMKLSAYRFMGTIIAEITSDEEIRVIEEAINNTSSLDPMQIQLKNAVKLLFNRQNPDFRNSIKESISAVETICKLIVKDPTATLSKALNILENSGISLHSDLKDGIKKLYHYTSDSNGIRHGLMDLPKLDFEDAKYMLGICSVFINYLMEKAKKAKIQL